MSMVFWIGYNLGDFLIEGLTVNSAASFALVAVFSFLLAVAVEGMKIVLAKIEGEYISSLLRNGILSRSFCERDVLMATSVASRAYQGVPLVLVYSLHLVMVYIVMLAVMQFNVYLFVAIILGSMCGYFFFSVILTRVRLYYLYLNSQHVNHLRKRMDQAEGTTPPLMHSEGTSSGTNLIYSCHSELPVNGGTPAKYETNKASNGSELSPCDAASQSASTSKNCGRGRKKLPAKPAEDPIDECVENDAIKENTPLVERKDEPDSSPVKVSCCMSKESAVSDINLGNPSADAAFIQPHNKTTQPDCCSVKET